MNIRTENLRGKDKSLLNFLLKSKRSYFGPGEYDGDGKFDAAVFRPFSATWFINLTGGSRPLIACSDIAVAVVFVR
jgi:hypothetical protein